MSPARLDSRGAAACLAAGLLMLAVPLLPPVHELAEDWFAAHMIEHELLMLIAAPLLVFGRLGTASLRILPRRWRRSRLFRLAAAVSRPGWLFLTAPAVAWALHGLALWLWHVPVLFEAALHSQPVHALQHLTLLCAAIVYWSSLTTVSRHGTAGRGVAVFSLFLTSLQCALLGALLTLAALPWYPDYPSLADQQWAGLVMWVPTGLLYAAAGVLFLARWLHDSESRARRWEAELQTSSPR
jgi:putative membrane protein